MIKGATISFLHTNHYIIFLHRCHDSLRVLNTYAEYQAYKSKSIMDEIDSTLARHYGFTDEELDFIINYDIKYRMGRETFGQGRED